MYISCKIDLKFIKESSIKICCWWNAFFAIIFFKKLRNVGKISRKSVIPQSLITDLALLQNSNYFRRRKFIRTNKIQKRLHARVHRKRNIYKTRDKWAQILTKIRNILVDPFSWNGLKQQLTLVDTHFARLAHTYTHIYVHTCIYTGEMLREIERDRKRNR